MSRISSSPPHVNPISEGSRPTSAQWPASTRAVAAKSPGAPPQLARSASRATTRSVWRAPAPAIRTGGCGCRSGLGSERAPRRVKNSPSYVTSGSVHSARTTSTYSPNRRMRAAAAGKSKPYASASPSYQPAPTPHSTRPPLITSRHATVLATRPGSRNAEHVASWPTRTRLVAWRSAPATVQHSNTESCVSTLGTVMRWSETHTESRPRSSASRARPSTCVHWAVGSPSGASSPRQPSGTITPNSIGDPAGNSAGNSAGIAPLCLTGLTRDERLANRPTDLTGEVSMRVLVTGGTGVFGRSVARLLAQRGADVAAMARHEPAVLPRGVEYVRGDVGDAASVAAAMAGLRRRRASGVVHALGRHAGDRARHQRRRRHQRAARDGAHRLLAARLLVLGDRVRLATPTTRSPTREDEPLRPDPSFLYGAHKQEGEALIAASGVDAVIARVATTLGRGSRTRSRRRSRAR